jgi:rod shape determining protein RodA
MLPFDMTTTARSAPAERDPTTPARNVDWLLVALALVLSGLGVAMVRSATHSFGHSLGQTYLAKEVFFVLLSALGLTVSLLFDYRRLRAWAPAMYTVAVLGLALVHVLGSSRKGAQSWFAFGPLQLEPGEPAKLALVVVLAAYLSISRERIRLRHVTFALVICSVPMVLIMLQPDLGTMLVFVVIAMSQLTVAGTRGRHLAFLAIGGVLVAAAVLSSGMLHDYQRDRLTVFVDDGSHNSQGAGYNVDQSKTAIQLGGLRGAGYGKGAQTQSGMVPEQQTDFIFTVVGEELGFVGSAIVVGLFALLALRVLRAAHIARDNFGTLLCVGVLAILVFHVFENIGMCMGIMPITGIPLPFLSYGGSALLTTAVSIGLVLNVRMRRYR